MKKIGICGHFNIGHKAVGGQTIRTRSLAKLLMEAYGPDQVMKVDTAHWKRKAPFLFFRCISMALHSEHIIVLPAKNGVKLLIPLFVLLSGLLGKKLHYIIIGAWLPDTLKKYPYLVKPLKKVDYIYAQTGTLLHKLSDWGIQSNTYLLPNFKSWQSGSFCPDERKYQKPYRLCILSRINHKKGIESAIRVISRINREERHTIVELDLYGPIEETYKESFHRLLKQYAPFVRYQGVLDYNKTPEIIKDYYLMLFPTKYYTEGFPGTILDAYFSGVPVLASRWESSPDVIREGITGYTYEFDNEEDFYLKLRTLVQNEQMVIDLKKSCLLEAEKYKAENVMKALTEHMNCKRKSCKGEVNKSCKGEAHKHCKEEAHKRCKGKTRKSCKMNISKNKSRGNRKSKKRIGLLIPNLQAGGSERVISLLSKLFTEAGHEVFLLLFDDEQISYPYQGTLLPLHCKSGKGMLHKGFTRILRIIKVSFAMKRYDLELVISFLYAANAVNFHAIGKARRVIACRGYRDYLKNGSRYVRMLKNVDALLVQTKRMKADFMRDFKAEESKLLVLGNPFPIKEIREQASDPIEAEIHTFIKEHKTLCTVGSFKRDKGYWHLIKIFIAVKKAVPEAGLIMIGARGEMEAEIKAMAALSPYGKDILFLGYQVNPFRYVAKCEVYVSTSIYEGFPNSMVEAMACGVPVIATDCKTGPREILCKDRTEGKGAGVAEFYGILVPELSDRINLDITVTEPEEQVMAQEIISLLQEEGRLEQLKAASLKRSEEFDDRVFASGFLPMIEKWKGGSDCESGSKNIFSKNQ